MAHDDLVTLPAGKMLAIGLGATLAVGMVAAMASALLRPEGVTGAGLGAAASAAGMTVATLAVAPWKPRPVAKWPMLLLAGHGAGMLGVLAAGALLYSAARPDPVMFLVAAAAPFPIATIGQARLVVEPILTGSGSGAGGQAPGAELQ